MTEYLTLADARQAIDRSGFVVTDWSLLSSAITRPRASAIGADAYPTIWLKAAALLESLSRNHALLDGNKRTALRLTALFLLLNEEHWPSSPDNEDFVVEVATGGTDLAASAAYLEAHCAPMPR